MINVRHLALFLATLSIGFATWLPANGAPAQGFRLEQKSDFYGASVVYVSDKSLRLQSPKYKLTLQVDAPTFGITGTNDNNHLYKKLTYKEWRTDVLGRDLTHHEQPSDMFKKCDTVIAGLPAEEWWVNVPNIGRVTPAAKDCYVNGKQYNVRYFVCKQIKAPMQMFEVFSDALRMPGRLGFPLRMIQYSHDGRPYYTFDTTKAERVASAPKLEIPKNYACASELMQLMVGGVADSSLAESIFGDDEDMGKSKPGAPRRGWVPGMKWSKIAEDAPAVGLGARKRSGWYPGRQ